MMKTSNSHLRKFKHIEEIVKAEISYPPYFARECKKKSKAQALGLRYERKVHEYLERHYPDLLVISPWLKFYSEKNWRWCQPDALLLDIRNNTICIIEVKIKHTENAWWQVRKSYIPVIKAIFGSDWNIVPIEVVKWFDPHTHFPEWFHFVDDISKFTTLDPNNFYVHIWNGR